MGQGRTLIVLKGLDEAGYLLDWIHFELPCSCNRSVPLDGLPDSVRGMVTRLSTDLCKESKR